MVGSRHFQVAQQVGVFAMGFLPLAGVVSTTPYCLQPHLAPQPLEALAIDVLAVVALQDFHQPPRADARVDQVDFIHKTREFSILGALGRGSVGERGARHAQ